ncbi:MAG: 2'-5' RNA ligase family protein [Bacillota bacterium]|nr:2'-5' RNA ligase family protein [Bacillota bacterium]
MKYYLVALFDNDSYNFVEGIQKDICKKHKLYKKLPTLHITLEILDDPNMEELHKVLSEILSPYKKFRVCLNGVICFDPPYKSVNLRVENKGYLVRLARIINEKLSLRGFNVKDTIHNWDLHVSLANTNYAARNWSEAEYYAACESIKSKGIQKLARIDRIELWKPVNNKKSMVVQSYPLRDY